MRKCLCPQIATSVFRCVALHRYTCAGNYLPVNQTIYVLKYTPASVGRYVDCYKQTCLPEYLHLCISNNITRYLNRYFSMCLFSYLPVSVVKYLSCYLHNYLHTYILLLVQIKRDKQRSLSMWQCLAFKGSVCPNTL